MEYKNAKIQILDLPGLITGASDGRGRGKEILSAIRNVDLIILMLDSLQEDHLEIMDSELFKAGIELSEDYIRLFPLTMENVVEQTNILLDFPSPPTAIFTYSDMYAIGVQKAARLRKLHVPEDLAVIGFDNIDAADFMELTTIDQNLEESGRLAVEVFLSRVAGRIQAVQNIELQIHIKERSTT